MPVLYNLILTHSSQQNLLCNQDITTGHSHQPYPLTSYPTASIMEHWLHSSTESFNASPTKYEDTQRVTAPSASSQCHSAPSMSLSISSAELRKVLDSILEQMDWLEVAIKVARDRVPSTYFNVIEDILLAHINQLEKKEGEIEDAFTSDNSGRNNCISWYKHDIEEDREEAFQLIEDSDDDGDDDGNIDAYEDEGDEDEDDELNTEESTKDSSSEYEK